MDFDGLANLSWREALIAVVVLLAIYVVIVFLRIWRLKRQKPAVDPLDALFAQKALAAYAAETEAESLPATAAQVVPEVTATTEKTPDQGFPWNEPPGDRFTQQIELLEREVEQLRKEVGGLRAEVLLMRERQQREALEEREEKPPRVTETVSPLYSDAMQMALDGSDAGSISQYCGISRAEAELVVALVRNSEAK